jgi:hypothetical protein
MRTALLTIAVFGTLATVFVMEAQAMPAPRLSALEDASAATAVRDRCGFRRHWSPRLQRCVWNG